jgi:hypothetical protein
MRRVFVGVCHPLTWLPLLLVVATGFCGTSTAPLVSSSAREQRMSRDSGFGPRDLADRSPRVGRRERVTIGIHTNHGYSR